jgi:hypothetical protein
MCHTLNNMGQRLNFETLSAFMTPWLDLVGGQHPHMGAKAMWRIAVHPTRVPGFSNTRWYSKAEIEFVLGENFDKLNKFLKDLDAKEYGEATREKLHAILDQPDQAQHLELELAAMLDLRNLVRYTYELEGDRLEMLLVFDRVERLRAMGRSLSDPQQRGQGLLANVDAVLRRCAKLEVGLVLEKMFAGHGFFRGRVVIELIDSTLQPGEEVTGYKVHYPDDNTHEDLEEVELRSVIYTLDMAERQRIIDCLVPAFEYLESRVLGTCDAQYSSKHVYQVLLTYLLVLIATRVCCTGLQGSPHV